MKTQRTNGRPRTISEGLPIYDTQKDISARIGIPLSVLKHAKQSGCTAFKPGGRVCLATFLRWFFGEIRKTDTLPAGLSTWGEFLNKQKGLREEVRLQREQEKLMLISDARNQAAEAMQFLFAEIDRACRELPPTLIGLPVEGILTELEKFNASLRKTSAQRFDQVGETK